MLTQKTLWLYIPLVLFIAWVAFEVTAPLAVVRRAVEENGFLEFFQVATVLVGVIAALVRLYQLGWQGNRFLLFWFAAAAAGSLYIAGEEISWGQWLFFWETPEQWSALNDQNETNLHNISSWLDQKPRIVLEIGIVVSSLILPFIRHTNPQKIQPWLAPLIPVSAAGFVAVLYILFKITDKSWDFFEIRLFERPSELIEFLIYYYIAAYIIDFDLAAAKRVFPDKNHS